MDWEDFLDDDIMDRQRISSSSSSSSNESCLDEEMIAAMCNKDKRRHIQYFVKNTVPSYSEREFVKHFRIKRDTFHYICSRFKNTPDYEELTKYKKPKSPEHHILLFLWYSGHEACSFEDIGDRFNVAISTVHIILKRVTYFISSLSAEFIKWPNIQKRELTEKFYMDKYKFPGIIGCIDGTHIRIDPPVEGKDDYINRKGDLTIHLQGICDHENKFIDIFTGYPGSVHDARVFKNSDIFGKLPQLCGDNYLLGDSAYPCMKFLLSPYRDNGHLTTAEKNFNIKLSKCRVSIEHTFGVLKQRFRQLYYCKLKKIDYLCHFIRACCVLHNLSDEENIDLFNEPCLDPEEETASEDFYQYHITDSTQGKVLRSRITNLLNN